MQFHQFEVTRPLRGSGEAVVRTIIVPSRSDLPDKGYYLARLRVQKIYSGATIRALGLTSRQVWEVV
jgi:hypothetical protein